VKQLNIPSSAEFNLINFLATPVEVRDWVMQGLPNDPFSQVLVLLGLMLK
jgi:hypothetical protein